MEIKVKRKLVNRIGDSRMLSLPPFFLDAMGAFDCTEVLLSVQDKDHIIIEMVHDNTGEVHNE